MALARRVIRASATSATGCTSMPASTSWRATWRIDEPARW
jgi:hypothetical protein